MQLDRSAGYGNLREMPGAIWRLVRNPTYFAISLGACMDAFILAGKKPKKGVKISLQNFPIYDKCSTQVNKDFRKGPAISGLIRTTSMIPHNM